MLQAEQIVRGYPEGGGDGDQVFQRRGARAGLIGGDYAGTEIGPLRHLKLGKIIFQTKLLKAFGENRNHGHYPFRGSVGRMQPFGKFLRVPPVSAFFYFIENNPSEGVVNSTFRRIKIFFAACNLLEEGSLSMTKGGRR